MSLSLLKKFFTKEDVFGIHKILGVTCLAHFAYRIYNIATTGDSGLIRDKFLYVWILLHMALSGTSLMFHIPRNRVSKRPMIYPEFRLHSILFAYRSLLVMAFFEVMWMRCLVTLVTIIMADMVTKYYRAQDTTMRGMPYGDNVPIWFRLQMNVFYSVSQVLATMQMLFARRLDVPFIVLFPIQFAAFLMTCVRKGVLAANGWHVLYTAALLLNYWYGWLIGGAGRPWVVDIMTNGIPPFWKIALIFCVYRFYWRINKYMLWCPIMLYAYNNA